MNNWRLQNSTAEVQFKAFLTGTDTPATGKTIAIQLRKVGGSFANPNAGASNATEIANGWYRFTPAAQDRDTLGPLIWRGTEGTIDPTETEELIVDPVRLGITALPNAAAEAAGGLITRGTGAGQVNQDANGRLDARLVHLPTALTMEAGTIAALGIVDNGTAQSVPDTTHTQLRAGLSVGDGALRGKTLYIVSATTGAGQSVQITNNVGATDTVEHEAFPIALTGTVTYIVFASPPTPASVANGSALTAIGDSRIGNLDATVSSRATPAQVNTEVDTALADIHLDHLLAADYNPAAKPGVATALLNELVESDSGVSRFTANSLEQAPTGGGASAGAIADAVWDEARGDHNTAGTFGEGLQSTVASREAAGAAVAAIASHDPPTRAEATADKNEILSAVGDVPTNAELATALTANIAALLATTIHGQTIANLLSAGGSFNVQGSADGLTLTVRGHDGTTITTRPIVRADFQAIRSAG